MSVFNLPVLYAAGGLLLLGVAFGIARDRNHAHRVTGALFWTILGAVFIAGDRLPPWSVGAALAALAVLAATGRVVYRRRSDESPAAAESARGRSRQGAARLGNRLFWPALLIPGTAVAGSLLFSRIHWGKLWLLAPENTSVVAVSVGALLALAAALRLTGARPGEALGTGSVLLQTGGWALILPQYLAALGGIFGKTGVGAAVATVIHAAIPAQTPFTAVLAYGLAMLILTCCLGNAFAAFAVATGGIGLPLIVQLHHGNPAIMAAMGMLAGYCGTLLTPLAATFNVVPVLLLELDDRYAVIKAQAPLAAIIFLANLALMYACVYRF
jgi:uncharacterized membrane protein